MPTDSQVASGLGMATSEPADPVVDALPQEEVRDFRARMRVTPLRPMEDLSGRAMSMAEAQEKAHEILSLGWTRRGYPTVDLAQSIPWEDSARRNRSWSFYLHSWDLLDALLLAYSSSADRELLTASLRVAMEWVKRFSATDEDSLFAWYDMAVGLRAARLAFLIDAAARIDVSDDDLRLLIDSAERHRAFLADDRNIVFHNNHGFYQAAGQAALAKRLMLLPRMAEGYQQALGRLTVMLDRQFAEDGVHNEHSPDYHRMVVRTLGALLDSGLLSDEELSQRYRVYERALAWFVYPDGRIVNFGDSDAREMTLEVSSAKRVWQTEEMRFGASMGAIGLPPEQEHEWFPRSGYFVVRRRHNAAAPRLDSYLAVMGAYHSRTHKHADDLSLVWFERGRHILIDAGRYGYLDKAPPGSRLWKDGFWYANPARVFCESTHAHNTVEIDDMSYPRRQEKPYGSAIVRAGQAEALFFCEGHVRHFKTVRHARTIVFAPAEWLLVADWLWDTAKRDHRYTQWWHFSQSARISPIEQCAWQIDIAGLDRPVHVNLLKPDEADASIAEAQKEPRWQGWWSPAEEVLEPAPALGLTTRIPSPSATILTLFSLAGKAENAASNVSTSGREMSVDWSDGIGRHRLLVERPRDAERPIRIEYVQDKR